MEDMLGNKTYTTDPQSHAHAAPIKVELLSRVPNPVKGTLGFLGMHRITHVSQFSPSHEPDRFRASSEATLAK